MLFGVDASRVSAKTNHMLHHNVLNTKECSITEPRLHTTVIYLDYSPQLYTLCPTYLKADDEARAAVLKIPLMKPTGF